MCVHESEASGTIAEVVKVDEFKYLGSTTQSNGQYTKEVKERAEAGGNRWRRVSGMICDKRIAAEFEIKMKPGWTGLEMKRSAGQRRWSSLEIKSGRCGGRGVVVR